MAYVRTHWESKKTDIDAEHLNNIEQGVYELDAEYYKKLKEIDDVAPKGPTGQQGPEGDPGDQGPTGEDGDVGDPGEKGATGDQGAKGDQGDAGDNGDPGDVGANGDTGDKGPDGDPGDAGANYDINETYTELGNKSIIVSLNELFDSVGLLTCGFDKGESQSDNSHIIYPSMAMNIKQNDIFNIKSTALKNLDFSTTEGIETYFEVTTVNETEVKLKCIKALEGNKEFKFKATTNDDSATEITYTLSVKPAIDLEAYKANIAHIDKTFSRETVNIYNFKPGQNVKLPLVGTDGNVIAKPVKGKDYFSTEVDPKVTVNEATLSISTAVAEVDATYVMKIFFAENKETFCTVNIHTGAKPE